MKEQIRRLPGQGFGSSSTQHYPSVKQNRSDLSVFVCSPPADTQSERKKASLTSITPKFAQNL